MAAKKRISIKKENKEEIKIELKHVLLSFIAAGISYLAYFLNFPNSWNIVLFLTFLILLLVNFNKIRGVNIIICFIVWNAAFLPLSVFLMNISLAYKILVLAINLAIYLLIVYGLKQLKRWCFYLTIAVFVLSLLMVLSGLFNVLKNFVFNLPKILVIANNAVLLVFLIIAIVYIIKSKNIF